MLVNFFLTTIKALPKLHIYYNIYHNAFSLLFFNVSSGIYYSRPT